MRIYMRPSSRLIRLMSFERGTHTLLCDPSSSIAFPEMIERERERGGGEERVSLAFHLQHVNGCYHHKNMCVLACM